MLYYVYLERETEKKPMVEKKIQEEVNNQIQAEFQSAYLYLAFAAWFEAHNLPGFAHWMRVQWQEETEHGMKFYDHLLRRDGEVELKQLDAPKITPQSPQKIFEQVLEHERYITNRIHQLYELAKQEHDYPLQTLLHWFIDEQVEEEEAATEILERLKLVNDDSTALYILDRELAERQA